MLEIKHLKKSYEFATPLKDVNCKIEPGEVISIIGPSGTGKSTLLRCINGLETPTGGEIIYNGQNLLDKNANYPEVRKNIGMVFQSFNLFSHLTVLQNVMKPQIDLLGRSKQEAYDKAYDLLKQVGLAEHLNKFPDMLSGGQKQRVAIARTLAMDNEIILLDEPTSALDPAMVGEVEGVIQSLTKTGITMLIVTHEMRFAKAVSSRIFFMYDGIIAEDGTPEQIFEHPVNEATRKFIFRIHDLDVEIDSGTFDFYSCTTDISRFAEKNYLSHAVSTKIISVFEELIVIALMRKMKPDNKIRLNINCSEASQNVVMTISYNIDFDPNRDLEELSKTIIMHHSADFEYTPKEKDDDFNKITVSISKN